MRLSLIFILTFGTLISSAQDKLLTISDAITGYHLYPRGLNQLQWLPSGNWFSQVKSNEGKFTLVVQEMEVKGNGRTITVSLSEINEKLSEKNQLKRLPFANWISDNTFQFSNKQQAYSFNIETKKVSDLYGLDVGVSAVEYVNNGKGYVATISNGISYNVKRSSGKILDDKDGIVLGRAVHRNEFGINDGLFLSPNAEKLAYYEMDESMVSQYPLYNLNDTPATATMLRYPTAGSTSHTVIVKIKSFDDNSTIMLKTGMPEDQFLTNVSWTPDSKSVLIAVVNREQNHLWLNQYSAATGEFEKTLFEEQNARYVEPEHPAIFLKSNPAKFVWWSERDGYNHLYLYNADGSLDKQLTKGKYVITQLHGFSANGEMMFVTSTKESPLERHLYCINMSSGKTKKITQGNGYHRITANKDCSLFFDDYSSTNTPRDIRIIDAEGNLKENMHSVKNPLQDYKLGDMELGKLKGKSGDDLYYRVFKPIDFDASKKYPVVVYLYNGPHLQLVTDRWLGGANLWYQYMAQQGYVVFSIDGRGSADRGFEFESSIFRDCAEKEMEDQLTGVEWLKKQSWVDAERLGIHGWSYGGYMTTSMLSRHPGVFKVGVAGGPVIDWSLYEIMYTERYMDTPEENPEGYAKTNLKNHIENLEGKLLMIHGGQDDVVLWQHSLQYIQEAIKKGVQLDYFVYPHHKHNVYGKDRIHLYEKVSNYFFDNL